MKCLQVVGQSPLKPLSPWKHSSLSLDITGAELLCIVSISWNWQFLKTPYLFPINSRTCTKLNKSFLSICVREDWFWMLSHWKSPVQCSSFRYEYRHVLQGQRQVRGQRAKQSSSTEKAKWSDLVCISADTLLRSTLLSQGGPGSEEPLGWPCQGFSVCLEQALEPTREWETATCVAAKTGSKTKSSNTEGSGDLQYFS